MAGLEEPDSGKIVIAGKTVAALERGVYLSSEKRHLDPVRLNVRP